MYLLKFCARFHSIMRILQETDWGPIKLQMIAVALKYKKLIRQWEVQEL